MLSEKAVLIVEDNVYLALDLSQAVEEANGRVVGPVGTVAEALALLDEEPVAAALLDSRLADRDVTPVVMALAARGCHSSSTQPPPCLPKSFGFIPIFRFWWSHFTPTRSSRACWLKSSGVKAALVEPRQQRRNSAFLIGMADDRASP